MKRPKPWRFTNESKELVEHIYNQEKYITQLEQRSSAQRTVIDELKKHIKWAAEK